MQKILKLKFKRITNSLKRKRLPYKICNLITASQAKKLSRSKFVMSCLLLICSVLGFSQSKTIDTTWTSIYKKSTDKVFYSTQTVNYNEVFYRNIQVPIYNSINSNQQLLPIRQNLEALLKQTQLDKSYSVSEVKGTELEKSLKEVEQLSYPFSSIITSEVAKKINLETNDPVLVSHKEELYQLTALNSELISTKEVLKTIHENSNIQLDTSAYLRYRLLSFLIGDFNKKASDYKWKKTNQKIIPFINSYQNQYMIFDGTYKIISKLVRSYKHLESYSGRIKNIKKVSQKFIGFDVNILSAVTYEQWEKEVSFIQEALSSSVVNNIKESLPKGMLSNNEEALFEILNKRVLNIDKIATEYYNLISPNKVVIATNENNLIDIIRKSDRTIIKLYNEKEGKNIPFQEYYFSTINTDEIWVYGLNGNDYFEVSGTSNKNIKLKLIGGNNSDKYEIQTGEQVEIVDANFQTFIVDKDKAKVSLSKEKYITTYDEEKYKHNENRIKPKFGANPDDGLFIGILNEYKVFGFNQNPYSTMHQVFANLYLGTLGFKFGYYGEKANVLNGFNAFGGLGYQSSNYSTNFFGFGNETPNLDDNLKLDYNRVRMSTFHAKLGLLKSKEKFNVSTNLFFESIKIDETADRFVTSETLFFPTADFLNEKIMLV